jgi:bifunctional non-homologous end joining protein LigD
VGRVGAGLAGKAGDALLRALHPLHTSESPFGTDVPAIDAAGAQWVEPVLVADVESLGLGARGRLRQPSWKGLREDLSAEDVDPADVLGAGSDAAEVGD